MKPIGIALAAAAALTLSAAGAQAHPSHGSKETPPGLAKKPYGMPPGQAKKMGLYRAGQHLPRDYYRDRNYYLSDYGRYELRAPPPGYRWVRVGNDVYLTQTRNGLIAEVIAGLFN